MSEERTADGFLIVEGLRVWNNELRRVTITLEGSWLEGDELWFYTREGGLTSQSRVASRHPMSGEFA